MWFVIKYQGSKTYNLNKFYFYINWTYLIAILPLLGREIKQGI